MLPTDNSNIRQTEWFVNPANPLLEYKIFSAKVGNLLYFITAKRGVTSAILPITESFDKPIAVEVPEAQDIPDNSADQFAKLVKFINSPNKNG